MRRRSACIRGQFRVEDIILIHVPQIEWATQQQPPTHDAVKHALVGVSGSQGTYRMRTPYVPRLTTTGWGGSGGRHGGMHGRSRCILDAVDAAVEGHPQL
eukprot:6204979-Pleurochrysis_carterae.AAC.5